MCSLVSAFCRSLVLVIDGFADFDAEFMRPSTLFAESGGELPALGDLDTSNVPTFSFKDGLDLDIADVNLTFDSGSVVCGSDAAPPA